MVFSLIMLPPVGVSLHYGDGGHAAFLAAFAWLVAVGAVVWWPARRDRRDALPRSILYYFQQLQTRASGSSTAARWNSWRCSSC